MDLERNNIRLDLEAIGKAVHNDLIIENICSFMTERKLFKSRFISHLFNRQATRRLKFIQEKPVNLHRSESAIDDFLALMRTRIGAEEQGSFPFSAFKLDLRHTTEAFDRFAAEAGHHVRRLEFETLPGDVDESLYQIEQKVIKVVRRAPNLVSIELKTNTPVYLTSRDQDVLPQKFPYLRIINFYHKEESENNVGLDVSLLSSLISRAGSLKHIENVIISRNIEGNHGLSAVQTLALKQRHGCIPLVRIRNVTITLNLAVLNELNKCNPPPPVDDLVAWDLLDPLQTSSELLQAFSDWTLSLSTTLKTFDLFIHVLQPNQQITYPLPSIIALEEFKLELSIYELQGSSTTFHIPLDYNQFPVLRKLTISLRIRSQDTAMSVEERALPSVREFRIEYNSSLLEMNRWHKILPNITSIYFNTWHRNFDKPNLKYILTHFPRITALQISFDSKTDEPKLDCWDLLTGSAPRPASPDILLKDFEIEQTVPEEPIDGVYQVSSLSNLRALETLICKPVHRSNLDAILYLARTQRLVHLKSIDLRNVERDLSFQAEEMAVYRDILARVNIDVSF